MRDEEILRKAIDKAVENNWLDLNLGLLSKEYICFLDNKIHILGTFKHSIFNSVSEIIFSHSFAKAFWGDDFACPYCGGRGYIYGDDWVGYWKCGNFDCDYSESFCTEDTNEIPTLWQYYLTRMVLEENPLQYLVKFLDEEKG